METIGDAKDYLRRNMVEGRTCPVCNQYVKLYQLKLSAPMVKALIAIYEFTKRTEPKDGWIHIPTELSELSRSRAYPKLAHWGLLEDRPSDDETVKCSGFWRVTEKGKLFLAGKKEIPLVAYIYNGDCHGLGGKLASVYREFHGFDYRALMEGK